MINVPEEMHEKSLIVTPSEFSSKLLIGFSNTAHIFSRFYTWTDVENVTGTVL